MKLAILLAALILTGCATAPPPDPRLVVKPLDIPVAVRCTPDLGPEPAYPDTDAALAAAPDLFSRVQLLLAGRLMRIGRDGEKTAALQTCAG